MFFSNVRYHLFVKKFYGGICPGVVVQGGIVQGTMSLRQKFRGQLSRGEFHWEQLSGGNCPAGNYFMGGNCPGAVVQGEMSRYLFYDLSYIRFLFNITSITDVIYFWSILVADVLFICSNTDCSSDRLLLFLIVSNKLSNSFIF